MASESFENIVADFEFLEDWEDRYRYVIELGKAMAPLEDAFRQPATKVEGCASQVWIVPEITGQGTSARFDFRGESDAMIVQGLIAVLRALYGGLEAQAVPDVDAVRELGRLGLDQHLSAQRSNGLRAMVERIRSIAAKTLQSSE